jgi:hypothetical protein
MKKIVKIKGIVSVPNQLRYIGSSPHEREELRPIIESESQWMIQKMERKGFRMEGTVADVYGIFTRGPAVGTLCVCDRNRENSVS